MKSTNKKTNIKTNIKKIQRTILLLSVLIVALAIGIISLIVIRHNKQLDMPYTYNVDEELYGTHGAEIQMQKSDAFASELCVSAGNVSHEAIAPPERVKSALMDLDNHEVLFAQNIHDKAYPASITKLMTALVAVKYGNLSDTVTISSSALNLEEGSTETGLQAGDQATLDELLHALLIYSGNDAAMAIAEHVGGTVDQFVSMMNEEAYQLGATNTHFVNPSGLHDENHYTTVYDIYLMLKEAISSQYLSEIMTLNVYNFTYTRGEETLIKRLDSTDQYLTKQVTAPKGVTVLGGKTGTTSDAGSCLALVSQNAYGEYFISIVLNAPTKASLYSNMNQLLEQINS